MYIVSPQNIVDRYIKDMTRFYSGYWTVCIGCYGYIGTFIYSILMAFLIAFYSVKFAKAIESKDYIKIFLTSATYYVIFQYFNEADYSYLFSVKMLVFTIIIANDKFFEEKSTILLNKVKEKLNKRKEKVN